MPQQSAGIGELQYTQGMRSSNIRRWCKGLFRHGQDPLDGLVSTHLCHQAHAAMTAVAHCLGHGQSKARIGDTARGLHT